MNGIKSEMDESKAGLIKSGKTLNNGPAIFGLDDEKKKKLVFI